MARHSAGSTLFRIVADFGLAGSRIGQGASMARERSGAIISSGLVLLVAGGFCIYARASQTGGGHDRYPVVARFVSANGLNVGADVAMDGVPVGRVTSITLDPVTYMANVALRSTVHCRCLKIQVFQSVARHLRPIPPCWCSRAGLPPCSAPARLSPTRASRSALSSRSATISLAMAACPRTERSRGAARLSHSAGSWP